MLVFEVCITVLERLHLFLTKSNNIIVYYDIVIGYHYTRGLSLPSMMIMASQWLNVFLLTLSGKKDNCTMLIFWAFIKHVCRMCIHQDRFCPQLIQIREAISVDEFEVSACQWLWLQQSENLFIVIQLVGSYIFWKGNSLLLKQYPNIFNTPLNWNIQSKTMRTLDVSIVH